MADEQAGPSEQQVLTLHKQMRAELQSIANKLGELEVELNEHSLVIGAIEKLDAQRKCFRLVGGVLVERTVEEVLPAVTKNKEGIKDLINQLNATYDKKSAELDEFVLKYKIQYKGAGGQQEGAAETEKKSTSTGVLA
ncbi:putative prefoldin subunit 2-like isoform 2 [Planoprotostelium fungivorum]|uniref:Putative prefoldin subunit 2-like isoform 2 n=1 Tax=Planoprotostelium fungivorum TaxID=1890364 RepID=A0A2P6N5B9_9EUKA|nr:putative prefoldin subunit 2-like isoform 2 [Planoprotostelium fungivorum]